MKQKLPGNRMAGKGDRNRVANVRSYRKNFDAIDWRSKAVKDSEKIFKDMMRREREKPKIDNIGGEDDSEHDLIEALTRNRK